MLLTFSTGPWYFGFPLDQVLEVQPLPDLLVRFTEPNGPAGLVQMRGETLAVWDLGQALGITDSSRSGPDYLLVTKTSQACHGWIINGLKDVVDISSLAIIQVSGTPLDRYLSGGVMAKDGFIFMLDPRHLEAIAQQLNADANNRAIPPPASEPGDDEEEFISFTVTDQYYALPVSEIREIQPVGEVTPIPCVPSFIRGVMNLRGGLLSVIDLHHFLGIERPGLSDMTRVIVLECGLEVGIGVREVLGLSHHRTSALLPVQSVPGGIPAAYLRGMLVDFTLVLNASAMAADPKLFIHDAGPHGFVEATRKA